MDSKSPPMFKQIDAENWYPRYATRCLLADVSEVNQLAHGSHRIFNHDMDSLGDISHVIQSGGYGGGIWE